MKRKMKLSLVVAALLGLLAVFGSAEGSDANLVAYWAFDEGSGAVAYDSAGGNDGTLNGDPNWTDGKIEGSLNFDGDGDYANCGTELALMEVSVCAWVKTSDSGGQIVFSKKGKSYGGHSAYSLITGDLYGGSGVGTVSIRIKQPGSVSFIDLATTERIDDGEWHFIAMSYDGTIAKIYIDGDLKVTSHAGSGINYYSENEPAGIGATRSTDGSPAAFFNGLIDEVMIFDGALSAEEVEVLYLDAFSGSELAIMQVEDALAEKDSALDGIDAAIEKELAAYEALEELLESKDYGDLKKGDIVKAKQGIHSAMQHQEQSAGALEKSIERLEHSLLALGVEPEPEVVYAVLPCDMNSAQAEHFSETRFSVTVEGSYIYFEDMVTANCCADEVELEMGVEDYVITLYETEETPNPCWCICPYPVSAVLGPFGPGTYTVEVYEDYGGFIGSTTVTIGPGKGKK